MAKSSVFDRLSNTETYASKRLKEKKQVVEEEGRPLYNIEVDSQSKSFDSNSLVPAESMDSTTSFRSRRSTTSKMSVSSNSSVSSRSTFSSKSNFSRGSIFERLAYTHTTSSSRKDKTSGNFDKKKDQRFQAEDMLRTYGNGTTRFRM